MYQISEFFKFTIHQPILAEPDVPPLQHPFNYIHINPREMYKGYNGEICMIKAYELQLRNIKGR